MINVSTAFLYENGKLVSSPEGKIIIDGLPEISAGGLLQSFTVERYDNESGKLFGNAISRKIDAVFMDNGFRQADIVGKKITAYTGHNGKFVNFTPCYVSELTYDKITDIWNLTAYDVLGEFNKYTVDAFYNAYPDIDFTSETLCSFAAKVISFVNSQSEHDIAPSDEGFFNSDLVLGAKPNFGGSENLRTVLMQIAECGFSNCIVNRSGKIEFRAAFKTNPVYEISPKTYYELSQGDNYGVINSLVLKRLPYEDNVYAQDGTSISENGLCEISISDNAFLDDKRTTVAISMLEKVKGYNLLNAYYLDWKGNAALDTSDCVRIKGIDENSPDIVTMYYGEIFTYDGSTTSVSELILPEDSQTDYSSAQNAMLYDRMKKAEIKVDKVENQITSLVSETLPVVKKSYIVELSSGMYAINTDSGGKPVNAGNFAVTVSVRLGDAEINDFSVSTTHSYAGIAVNISGGVITFSWSSAEAIGDVNEYNILVNIDGTVIGRKVTILAVENGEVPYIKNGTWHIGDEDTGVRADWSSEIDGLRGAMSQQKTEIIQTAEQLALQAVKEYAGTDKNGNRLSLIESITNTIENDKAILSYKKAVDDLNNDLDSRFEELTAYLRWGPLDDTGSQVGIEMGVSNDEIKVRLINDKLVFYTGNFISADSDNVIQAIDAKSKSAKLGNTLQYGGKWEHGVDSEGNFYHAWIGG